MDENSMFCHMMRTGRLSFQKVAQEQVRRPRARGPPQR